MNKEILKQLGDILGRDHLLTAPEELACYSFDGSGGDVPPQAVAFPENTTQISKIMQLANKYRIPIVPRGAGSGMTGGAVPLKQGLVLVMNRMNRILEIDRDNMIAVAEPGVITGELQATLKKQGLMYPPDPASLKFCTLGGNAAECAGGPSAVKYGVTRDYIIGCEAVMPTGKIITTGVRTEKGVTGYDLTHLLIGSEGTLVIFTKLILRLLPLPEAGKTFLLLFTCIDQAVQLVAELLQSGIMPCTMEYMDHTAISVVRDRLPSPLPEKTEALLLLELDGSRSEVQQQTDRLRKFLAARPVTLQEAENEAQRQRLWQARRSISPATFSLKPHKISEDVVVPRSKIPTLVRFTSTLAEKLKLIILTFGHAGDGNIHVNIMIDKNDPEEYKRGQEAKKQLFRQVITLGGTLSGEHGIGTTKATFLSLEITPETLELMWDIKQLFDPNNILNPGKIFIDE
ncbi:MAG TPA: FAD-binding protein [Desulfobulbaceae bacterium]|nr:FAD-binding protein [Desulfobulbaceae bacterium]